MIPIRGSLGGSRYSNYTAITIKCIYDAYTLTKNLHEELSKFERNLHHYLLKLSFSGRVCMLTHRLAHAISVNPACALRAGIKLHLSCTVFCCFQVATLASSIVRM